MLIGTTIGPYTVLSKVGEGGMGEVYRARDVQLNRDVAIKILPPHFVVDAERLGRFTREAQTLASLNHPNIAQIYGLVPLPPDGVSHASAIVMELVDGEDLSVVMARGPLTLSDTLAIARQIAEGLEAAHEQGVIHRDLKPANVKVRRDGTVKILDFGLAKAMDPIGTSSMDAVNSPTFTAHRGTQLGVILGTAAYMAPEQARGKAVDKRADIWAFGVILFEMLAGKPLFAGETVSDVLAAVLTGEPEWSALPAATPPHVLRAIARSLERDPRRRLRDIGDVRFDLEDTTRVESARAVSPAMRWLPWFATAIAATAATWAFSTRMAPAPDSVDGHFTIQLPADAALVTSDLPLWSEAPVAVAPDGRQIVYVAPNGRGTQLFARTMDDLTPRALAGTDGAGQPFFSPDGQWVGFFAHGKLKKSRLAGGSPATLADAPQSMGGSWGTDGVIVFAPSVTSGLFTVPDAGGTPRRLTSMDFTSGDDVHGWPQVLGSSNDVLFTIYSWSRETNAIAIVNLATGKRRIVQQDAAFGRYTPDAPGSRTGHIVFVRDGALMAAALDPSKGEAAGTPVTVLNGVTHGQFDISASGVLAYAPGSGREPVYSLVWVDRAGVSRAINELPRGYEDLGLSPDGRLVALTVEEAGADFPAHVWLADTQRATLTRLTFDGYSRDPVWAPDGQSIVFGSKRGTDTFGLFRQRLNGGSAELLWASPTPIWPDPQSWTPDGKTIVFATKGTDTSDDLWTLSVETREARPLLQTVASEGNARVSPDGRWMAYESNESGRYEVYVQPFPGPGAKRLVSEGGGSNALWSRNGRELFFRKAAEFFVATVETTGGFTSGKPAAMFSGRYRRTGRDYDVSADGTRFVMMRNDDPRTTNTINVLLNWRKALAARLNGTPQ